MSRAQGAAAGGIRSDATGGGISAELELDLKFQSSIGYGAKTGSVRSALMAEHTPPETSVHTDAEHARAGETPGITRYILGISLVLAVVILSLIVWGPVLFHQ